MAASSDTAPRYGCIDKLQPMVLDGIKEGDTKYWCRCGLSKKQPWCDGSHKGTDITPLKWTADGKNSMNGKYAICLCKQTKNAPFCDGSHVTATKAVQDRIESCPKKGEHQKDCTLCTGCGGVGDLF